MYKEPILRRKTLFAKIEKAKLKHKLDGVRPSPSIFGPPFKYLHKATP